MLGDTIFAVASPPGAAARGVLRVSGPAAFDAAEAVLGAPLARERATRELEVRVAGFAVPCLVLAMPGPRSFTGEDVIELHLPGSPVLLDEVACGLRGARLATPGEFTRRAFEHGRLDLSAAEAVLQLIHAADLAEVRFAAGVLRGGLAHTVAAIRSRVQDAAALLEAGLDFGEDDTGAVPVSAWLPALQQARARCAELLEGLPAAAPHGDVLLLGAANAGKSSLANRLAGRSGALVSDIAGTTRDVLVFDLGDGLRLLDGPGDLPAPQGTDAAALRLRDAFAREAGAVLAVIDLTAPRPVSTDRPVLARVYTKLDLVPAAELPAVGPDGVRQLAVSAVTGAGVAALAAFLRERVGGGPCGLSARLREHLSGAAAALDTAIAGADAGAPEELVAVDLGAALEALDAVHGRSTPDDLLDRIFAGFCLGK